MEMSLQKKGLLLVEEEVKEAKSADPLRKIMNVQPTYNKSYLLLCRISCLLRRMK
jgi:hypothetical protein